MADSLFKRQYLYRQRLLPSPGKILVKRDQWVTPGDVVARAEIPGTELMLNLSHSLDLEPEKIEMHLQVQIGQEVEKGQLLAQTLEFLSLWRKQVYAPANGTVEALNKKTGILFLRKPNILLELTAYLQGQIAEILPAEGVIIEAEADTYFAAFGVGGESFGQLRVACQQPDELLTVQHVTEETRGSILLGGCGVSADALQKANRLQVAGIISGGICGEELNRHLGYQLGVPITGHEKIATSLILTEGFGLRPMQTALHEQLQNLAGRTISINGTTHLRSRQILPEIIIPLQEHGASPTWA